MGHGEQKSSSLGLLVGEWMSWGFWSLMTEAASEKLHSPACSEHSCTPLGLAWTQLGGLDLGDDWQQARTMYISSLS